MSLKTRIIVFVVSLFIAFFAVNFMVSYYEIHKAFRKHTEAMNKELIEVDDSWNDLVKKYLANNFTHSIEEIDYVFNEMDVNEAFRKAFLPNNYNIKTNTYETSTLLLSKFPWIDLINVTINDKNSSFIHFNPPFLHRYVHIEVASDIHLFITQENDDKYTCYVGVPFFVSPEVSRGKIEESTEWLLYDTKTLLKLDPSMYVVRNNLEHDPFVKNRENRLDEYEKVISALRKNTQIVQSALKKAPFFLKKLANQSTKQIYLKGLVDGLDFIDMKEKQECKGSLCEYQFQDEHSKWVADNDFKHRNYLQRLTKQFFALGGMGPWYFNPLSKIAPTGFCSTTTQGKYTIDNIAEGTLVKNIVVVTPINSIPHCNFQEIQQDAQTVKADDNVITSCDENDVNLFFNQKLNTPFLTSTKFIKLRDGDTGVTNISAITLGVNLDPIFKNLATTSGDVLVISKNNRPRFYYNTGEVSNIYSLFDTHKDKLFNQKSGTLVQKNGSISYFVRLGNITENDGHIILIEELGSRSQIMAVLGKDLMRGLRNITIANFIISCCCIILAILILLQIIAKITKPINELAIASASVGEGKLEGIDLPTKYLSEKDEVGKLYTSFSQMIHSMQEGEKVRGLLDKVVSKEIAAKIVEDGVNLTGEIKHISILFCDIRGFTSITEKMDPKDVLTMLNECLTLLSNVIDSYEGVIDNFEGDCIMVLFGAPVESQDHAKKAVDCAIEMQNVLEEWNGQRERSNLVRLDLGIGIHTGDAVAGNVGTTNHLSYSVLGHMVNLTSRICDVADKKEILISKETLDEYSGLQVEQKEPYTFKGISKPVTTYKILYKK